MTLADLTLLYPTVPWRRGEPFVSLRCVACGVMIVSSRIGPAHPGCMLSDADRCLVLAAVDAGRRVDVLRRLRELGVNEKYGNAIVDAAIARRERALRDAARKGVA